MMNRIVGFAILLMSCGIVAAATKVSTLRVPENGIQPQVAIDTKGTVHLIYFKGDPANGDLFYTTSADGSSFAAPMKVNSVAGSAIATGNIRGAHLALGKNGRVHVAWMGSGKAPKGLNESNPMLYTRLKDDGSGFEPEKNVIQLAPGLDGGGTVAADIAGNVYVFWHAPEPGMRGENNRRVWMAKSTDDGKTFAKEVAAFPQPTGACGCCGMSAYCDAKGDIFVLYRSASGGDKPNIRDMYFLVSNNKGGTFTGLDLSPWKLPACAMSTSGIAEGAGGILATWETQAQVFFSKISAGRPAAPVGAPGNAGGRKHSAVAGNAAGEVLLAWTEGMAWQKGGSVNWQLYDKNGQPEAEKGKADGVPANSVIAAFAKPDGNFVVVY